MSEVKTEDQKESLILNLRIDRLAHSCMKSLRRKVGLSNSAIVNRAVVEYWEKHIRREFNLLDISELDNE